MPLSLLPSLISFCIIIGYTPGPANLLSLSTALKFGRNTAFKLWRGLLAGFTVINALSAVVAIALGDVILTYLGWITYIGAAYIFYLAFHTVNNSGKSACETKSPNMMTGFLMQLTNAKMIIFCLTGYSLYVLPFEAHWYDYLIVGAILTIGGPGANLLWLMAGSKLQSLFAKYQLLVDLFMGLALAFCAILLISRSPFPKSINFLLSNLFSQLMF